jgi:integrase
VRTVDVGSWLRSLARARSTCAKIRNLMSVLFNHAWQYEFFDRNPIKLVPQSAKRRTAPSVLVPAEIKLLLDNLEIRERTLVLLAASTGLRQSELFALKWGDIDLSQTKTEASQKPVPVHPILAAALTQWRARCHCRDVNDWVFANEHYRDAIHIGDKRFSEQNPTCCRENRDQEVDRLAYLPPHLLDTSTKR